METRWQSVRLTGPLAAYGAGFAEMLGRRGYRATTICGRVGHVAQLSSWLERRGIDADQLTSEVIKDFLKGRRQEGHTEPLTLGTLQPLLDHLREVGAAPLEVERICAGDPVGDLVGRYREHLERERGLAPDTVASYAYVARLFLSERVGGDGLELRSLDAAAVTEFLLAGGKRLRRSARHLVSEVRSLLRFLHLEGETRALAELVPAFGVRRGSHLPRGLEPGVVDRLLESCDPSTVPGRRDLAVLTMLARLGLRVGEVAALQLDDIDWRRGELVVRGKGNHHERLPLPVDVGEALSAYVLNGRPHVESRQVFVRLTAPLAGMSRGAVEGVVQRAAQRASLERIAAHRLRHTTATTMLKAGVSLPEVGQVLRHRSLSTTAIYAKVDRNSLRRLARPWPGGAA